jgi:hypothetical protein
MYISISWHPTTASRPRIEQTSDLTELLRAAYLAGLRGEALSIHEYRFNERPGAIQWRLFDSTVITVGDIGERQDPSPPTVEQDAPHQRGA